MARSPAALLQPGTALTLAQVADGAEGLVLADLARADRGAARKRRRFRCAVICRDGQRMAALSRALAFFGPDILTMEFPAWDCLPYDRVSPNASVVAQRMTALSRLARVKGRDKPSVLLTTVNAALQRVPAREFVATHALSVAPGNVIGMAGIVDVAGAQRLHPRLDRARAGRLCGARRHSRSLSARHGSCRCGSISSATRWRPSRPSMRRRNAAKRPCAGSIWCRWRNSSSITETIRRFRTGYVAAFGAATPDDLLVRSGERRPPLSRHGALAAAVPRQARDGVRLSARHAARARASGRRRRA